MSALRVRRSEGDRPGLAFYDARGACPAAYRAPRAPEICVEIPSVAVSEVQEKQALYFEAGAQKVLICGLDGKLRFHVAPGHEVNASRLCPEFPREVA